MISQKQKLVVAVTSRALFDLEKENEIYENFDKETYLEYQIENEEITLDEGYAFPIVKKLLNLDLALTEVQTGDDSAKHLGIEVILLSRNSADTGLRVMNSIEKHGLKIQRAAFCSGAEPHRFLKPFQCDLFLSKNSEDVRLALDSGVAAATMVSGPQSQLDSPLNFAFDADSVVFSNESEKIFQQQGLEKFQDHEQQNSHEPMQPGPFGIFLQKLSTIQKLQKDFSDEYQHCRLRLGLFTARNAPTHKRVITTLRQWQVDIDEMLFLGGLDKGGFLKAFDADIFFDDSKDHCTSAAENDVAAGHVPDREGSDQRGKLPDNR